MNHVLRTGLARTVGLSATLGLLILSVSLASAQPVATSMSDRGSPAIAPAISVAHTISVGKTPSTVVYDPTNKEIYVADSGAGKVSAINGTTNTVVKTIVVGTKPNVMIYNPHNARVYVLNSGSNSVSVIRSNNTIAATVAINATAVLNLVYDPANGAVYVLSYKFVLPFSLVYHLSRLNPTTNAVATIKVGTGGSTLLYDPATLDLVLSNPTANNLTIVNSSTNAVTALHLSALYPSFMVYNPANKDVYVVDIGVGGSGVTKTGNVSVLSSSNTIVATLKVAKYPISEVLDPTSHEVFVVSSGTPNATTHKYPNGTVTAINTANHIVTTLTVGKESLIATYDPANLDVYVPCAQSNATYVINGSTNVLVGSPIVSKQYPILGFYDPATKDMLVVGDSNATGTPQPTNVTVISSANIRIATLLLGKGPVGGGAYDPTNLDVYVSNQAAATVSVIH